MKTDKQLLEIAQTTLQAEASAIQSVVSELNDSFIEVVHLLHQCQGHVLVTGAGTSHTIATRFAHLLACIGVPAFFVHPADSLHGASGAIQPHDILFALSKGGETAEVIQLAQIAKRRGAAIIAFTEAPTSTLAQQSQASLIIKAPQAIDPFNGLMAVGSSLLNAAVLDAIVTTLLELNQYAFEDFANTHPGGAVGKKIEQNHN